MAVHQLPVDPDDRRDDVGDVYFIACNNEFVKAGFARFSVDERLKELQTGCPYDLKVIGVLHAARARAERWFHHAMREDRVRGEWFKLTDRVRLMIHNVNKGFWPTSAAEVEWLFEFGHVPEVAQVAEQMYISPAPDPNGSCSTPA